MDFIKARCVTLILSLPGSLFDFFSRAARRKKICHTDGRN